ncbi:hypothetical protein DY000_02026710 [Brassica cretica]|uniref:Remorin N-terminal domain-containing protein n=1 Tax=Brassica cretica TaxID=69181 RepID=A0ABQ7E484_BRACR|nr:hypothetical protein DY000_02026710 [Brassica cretica]
MPEDSEPRQLGGGELKALGLTESVDIVEDTEDKLALSCNPSKQEEHAVAIFTTPVKELPLKPSATTADSKEIFGTENSGSV